jgi:hypothetical protein
MIRHRMGRTTVLRSGNPLSDDQIYAVAPSVFAEEKHESRGERYTFIDTRAILDGLRREGFMPYEVRQTRVKDESKVGYAKHLIRYRHPDIKERFGGVPEIITINSHDGTSAQRIIMGFFRYICGNGMIIGDIQEDIRIPHRGNIVDNVIEGAFRVVDEIKGKDSVIDEMASIQLNKGEQLLLADTAARVRWSHADHIPVEAPTLLQEVRAEDRGSDLWSRFNVVQENLLKGGVAGRAATGRHVTTRAIQGVNENVRVNRALWNLAEAFAGLKAGRIDPHEMQARLVRETPEILEVQ